MSELDNDNIYVYKEEEDSQDLDNSPYNFASEESLDQEDETEEESEIENKQIAPFKLLLEIMFNPVQGWKHLRRSKVKPESLQTGCFYPLLAFLAISKFADYIYSVHVTLNVVITQAIVAFVSFFFGYFCILFLLTSFLPKHTRENFDNEFGRGYVIINLSTLAIFSIITDFLPMLWPVLIFLPLWTLYLIYRGSRFFKLAESQVLKFLVLTSGSIIGIPLLIEWVLNQLLPY